MVIRIIHKHGGSCPFTTILDDLSEVLYSIHHFIVFSHTNADDGSFRWQMVEQDKKLMSTVNWARLHKSNFVMGTEEDQLSVPAFKKDPNNSQNWIVAHPKVERCQCHECVLNMWFMMYVYISQQLVEWVMGKDKNDATQKWKKGEEKDNTFETSDNKRDSKRRK